MRILLLAGTSEARQIAAALKHRDGMSVTASVAAGTRAPAALGVPTRIGGFGGDAGFAAYLERERMGAVLDATHPFSAAISHRTARICGELGRPYAQLLRPSWRPAEGDLWHFAGDEASAAALVPEGARAFVGSGQQRLERFGAMNGRRVYVRQIERAPAFAPPFDDGHWLVGTPPFSVADETALFRGLGIDWLIVRNAGGSSSRAKLDAARALGLDVAMIRRPMQPEAIRLDSVTAALGWLRKLG